MKPLHNPLITSIVGLEFMLFAEKAAYIKEYKTLLVADLHLGKANHFRKNGIAVPHQAEDESLNRLASILDFSKPEQLIFMGDLFHSEVNKSWQRFELFLKDYRQCEMILVKGNHDILANQVFIDARLSVHDTIEFGPLLLSHDRCDSQLYNIYGHIHPAVRLRGLGRSYIKLPCFIFRQHSAILPAFGAFTGLACVKPVKADRVFVINDESVIDMSSFGV